MNEHADADSPEVAVRDYLLQLPQVPEARDLWTRIDASRRRRLGYRRAAAAMLAVSILAIALGASQSCQVAHQPGVLALLPSAPINHNAVQDIDHQLQAAYDRAASSEEIQTLWQARALAIPADETKDNRYEHLLSL